MIEEIISDVIKEMDQQNAKWGDQSHHPILLWNAILGEETGEVAKASLEENLNGLETELIQVAAVAIQFARAVRLKKATDYLQVAGLWIPTKDEGSLDE